ncbi:MAG: 3-dehydroquinate synthase [Planctomycetes bacterium]|nr:3-dehydroquinate synthase [Planctomycetota bacterium]
MSRGGRPDRRGEREPESAIHRQTFSVDFEYEVHFTRDVFRPENDLLVRVLNRGESPRRRRVFICIDAGVARFHPDLVRRIKDCCHVWQEEIELVASPEIVPGGEAVKNDWQVVQDLMAAIGNQHLDRQSYLLAIGGGSVLDMAGFVAALVHRGLRFVRMPTTVLGQNDAGIGVKNGMNEHGMKNFVGTFAPPFAVIDDFSFLGTLSDEHWRGGAAEAFKVAIIKDRDFFDWLVEHAAVIRQRDERAMEESIRRCALLHLDHIATSGDPFEFGAARPLDFGHWSAHKLETLSGYRVSHGAAVACGIALDSCYAERKGLITAGDLERILKGLEDCGLALWFPELERRSPSGDLAVIAGLEEFREHLGGRLTITLPDSVGRKVEVHHLDHDLIEESVQRLRARAARTPQGNA